MKTSPQPWHARHDSGGAYIVDANGETIGHFYDWRDAEAAVEIAQSLHRQCKSKRGTGMDLQLDNALDT